MVFYLLYNDWDVMMNMWISFLYSEAMPPFACLKSVYLLIIILLPYRTFTFDLTFSMLETYAYADTKHFHKVLYIT